MKPQKLGLIFYFLFIFSLRAQAQVYKNITIQNTLLSPSVYDRKTMKMVHGKPMFFDQNFVSNLSKSPEFAAILHILQISGLKQILEEPGPYTFFAFTHEALSNLSLGNQDTNSAHGREELAAVLKNYILPGGYTSREIAQTILKGCGETKLLTIGGDSLVFRINDARNLEIIDNRGNTCLVSTFDIKQSNGLMYIISKAFPPKPLLSTFSK